MDMPASWMPTFFRLRQTLHSLRFNRFKLWVCGQAVILVYSLGKVRVLNISTVPRETLKPPLGLNTLWKSLGAV